LFDRNPSRACRQFERRLALGRLVHVVALDSHRSTAGGRRRQGLRSSSANSVGRRLFCGEHRLSEAAVAARAAG
jgi:hypothetical protein